MQSSLGSMTRFINGHVLASPSENDSDGRSGGARPECPVRRRRRSVAGSLQRSCRGLSRTLSRPVRVDGFARALASLSRPEARRHDRVPVEGGDSVTARRDGATA
jgi:hypothetical protein